MPSELLEAITIETGANPDASVIWMHGLGDDGKGWSEVVPALNLPQSLAVRFIFPHAPVIAVTVNNGMRMRAWYDIRQANLSERADLEGVRTSQAHVDALIAQEVSRGIAARRVILAGFSQGGAIALYAGVRYAERLGGVVGLSTYLVGFDRVARGSECGESRRADIHGARYARRRRAAGVGRALARRAPRGWLGRRLAYLSDRALGGNRRDRRRRQVYC